ncbi:unnamed protein product, partial [Mesorhabditis belari]|uniref:FAM65 N-terminal domain-containing protein n=1 Tax=Mesorhabditis belari TaxID=2138241 RepID=A0AAF3J9Y5_9BILA
MPNIRPVYLVPSTNQVVIGPPLPAPYPTLYFHPPNAKGRPGSFGQLKKTKSKEAEDILGIKKQRDSAELLAEYGLPNEVNRNPMYTYRRPAFGSQQRMNGSTSSSATSSRPPLPKLPLWDAHQFRALNKATPEFYRRQTTQIDDIPINHSNHQPQIQQQQRHPVDGTLPRQTSRHIVQGSPSGLLLPRLRPPPNQLPRSIPPRSPPPYRPPPRNSPRLQQARQPRLESTAPKHSTPHREKSPSKQATNAIESTPVYAQPRPRMDAATLPRNFHVIQKVHDMPVDEGFSSNSMNSSQSSNDYMPSKAEPQVNTMTRSGMLQQKSFDETAVRVHPDYNAASMGRRNKVPVGAMFDDRRFSTMEATQRLYKKHNVSTNQLHDGYSTMPPDVARPRAPSAQSGMSPALHGVNTLPAIGIGLVEPPKKQRTDQIFDALVNGFRSYIAFYSGERDRLRAELEATNDAGTATRIEHELVLVEENVQLFESHLHRVSRLQDRYRQGHFASLKAKSSSLSDLRAALSGKSTSSSSAIAAPSAAIHNELAAMMGRLSIEMKTIAGFARVAPGDVFEVQIRHGNTKWKARGKTQADRTQRWDREATTFECHPSSTVDVKVCEVRLFKTKPLAERSFDPCELFAASPQMVTISLNTLGTMKLQMIVTWIPLLASKSGLASTITRTPTSMLSEQAEEAKKPRVVLREKKRGGAARAATKEQWRSSTNLLDSIYHDLSKNIPTAESMSTPSHRLSMLAVSSSSPDVSSGTPLIPPSTSNPNQTALLSAPQDSPESMRGRACTGGSQGVSSCSSATSSSDVVSLSSVFSALLDLLDECLPLASSLSKERHRELHTTHQILVHWSRILRHPNASGGASFLRRSAFVRGDEIDDNVLLADHGSENDSGIDSLRQQISPYARRVPGESVGHSTASRFSQMRERRKSLGAMLDPSELERMCLESDRFWQDEHSTAKHETATGHHEVDACLAHHLTRIRNSLKLLTGISGPLLYRSTEHLRRIEADTVALDDLLRLTPSLPVLPNITNVLCELGAEGIVQEAWLSACYPLHASLVVPFEELRTQLRANVSPIVEPTYPHLVTRVTESLCRLLLDGSPIPSPPSSPIQMTVFHFVSLFRGRHFAAFVESLAHDAWMISLLSTRQPRNVNIVFERLTQVPMAPPIDTLRHVALLLQNGDPHLNTTIERYLSGSVGRLHSDLLSSFLCLLEADDVFIRIGAIRALGVLKSARIAAQVWWVAERDRSQDVRHEAMCLLEDLGEVEGDKDGDEQVTRI